MGTCGLPNKYSTLSALGPVALRLHIRQTTYAHVTNTKCNTFTAKIKGIQRVTYQGLHHDVASPSIIKALLQPLYL